MKILDDNEIESILDAIKCIVRVKYYKRCRRLGWTNIDILTWAESVAGEGISLGLHEIHKWDRNRGTLSCWFYLCTKSIARDELRKLDALKRQGDLSNEALTELDHPIEDPFQSLLDLAQIKEALQCLTPIQREALVLYEYVGMKVSEMATLLCCPSKTIYTHLDRARKKTSLFRPINKSDLENKAPQKEESDDSESQPNAAGPQVPRPPPSPNISEHSKQSTPPTRRQR